VQGKAPGWDIPKIRTRRLKAIGWLFWEWPHLRALPGVKTVPGFDMGWTFCGSMYLVIPCLLPSSPMLVLSPTHAWDETPNEGKSGDKPITYQH